MPQPPRRIAKRITGLDSRIFASLMRAQRPLPVKQIASRVNVTWPTAKVHVDKLHRLNVLDVQKTIRRNRVFIDPNFMLKINKKYLTRK